MARVVSEYPKVVRAVRDAVSEKMGRPASVLRGSGSAKHRWYVVDPAFKALSLVRGARLTSFRAGILIEKYGRDFEVFIDTVHCPTLAKNFRKNLSASPLIAFSVMNSTKQLRDSEFIAWDSRSDKGLIEIEAESFAELTSVLPQLKSGSLHRDLFPVLPNSGKGVGNGPLRGHALKILLADGRHLGGKGGIPDVRKATAFVETIWPLFVLFYPAEYVTSRSASLRRRLKAAGVPARCELDAIQAAGPQRKEIRSWGKCSSGHTEAAHIIPYAIGGGDEAQNGLWLCHKHHNRTEGRLKGKRGKVRFS